jgi:hypothetical protein
MFSPRCEPTSTRQRAPGDVGALGRRDLLAESELEADVARAAALGVGRRDEIRRAVRLEGVLEEVAADAVAEKNATASGPCSAAIFRSFSAMKVERLVPGHLDPLVLAAILAPQQRRAQAVGVVVRADAAGATRTEPAARQRIDRGCPRSSTVDRSSSVAIAPHFQKQRSQ